MGKYSTRADIKDTLVKGLSKRSDHEEAEEYVHKVLTKIGIDGDTVEITPELKELAITYATYKRSFYESTTKDDVFYQKYLNYEKDLKEQTANIIKTLSSLRRRITMYQCPICKRWTVPCKISGVRGCQDCYDKRKKTMNSTDKQKLVIHKMFAEPINEVEQELKGIEGLLTSPFQITKWEVRIHHDRLKDKIDALKSKLPVIQDAP